MNRVEFAQAYDLQSVREYTPSVSLPELEEGRKHAYQFGEILHQALTEPERLDVAAIQKHIVSYDNWIGNKYVPLVNNIFLHMPPEDAARVYSEINFHALSANMYNSWLNVSGQALYKNESTRVMSISIDQALLALNAMSTFRARHTYSSEAKHFTYFDEESEDMRASIEGALQEEDTAIVLLNIAKKWPGLVVVPAPPQYEHGRDGSINVDLVVIDHSQAEAIGVQVKSNVRLNDRKTYDSKRVMLVDANIDLGNSLYKRTSARSSEAHRVSWAGLIAAYHLQQVSTNGPLATSLRAYNIPPQYLIAGKMQARYQTQGIAPKIQEATQNLRERLEQYLGSPPEMDAKSQNRALSRGRRKG